MGGFLCFSIIDWIQKVVLIILLLFISSHSATLLEDQLVVVGGWDAPTCFNDLHVLDLGELFC